MQAPNVVRGFLYPTNLVVKCPRYSQCTVCSKCQNYDRHRADCALCETRVRPAVMLGGMLPEGEYEMDVQLAAKILRDALNAAMAHPDNQGTPTSVDIANINKTQKATQILQHWSEQGNARMEVDDVGTYVHPEDAAKLADLRL